MDTIQVMAGIVTGQFDDNLEGIDAAVRDRRSSLAKAVLFSLKPGDAVQFVQRIKPKYLAGATATVRQINRTKAVVNIDQAWFDTHPGVPVHKWRGNVTVPAELLEIQ